MRASMFPWMPSTTLSYNISVISCTPSHTMRHLLKYYDIERSYLDPPEPLVRHLKVLLQAVGLRLVSLQNHLVQRVTEGQADELLLERFLQRLLGLQKLRLLLGRTRLKRLARCGTVSEQEQKCVE